VPGCQFDFAATYGLLGREFAEVHHLRPLADLDGPIETTLADLAVVCANCHRMLHVSGNCLTLEELGRHRQTL
jgi:5-methylcytosine-specific restriction protein A